MTQRGRKQGATWDDDAIRRLLACETTTQLLEAFPGKELANLTNRRSLFRAGRPDLLPDVSALSTPAVLASAPAVPFTPTEAGWRPGVLLEGDTGVLTLAPSEGPVSDWTAALNLWNLDPAEFEVIEPVTFKAWDMGAKNQDGEIETRRMYSYKATIKRRVSGVAAAELTALREQISLLSRVIYNADVKPARSGSTFVVALSDWQMGKGENGGSAGTVERIQRAILAAVERLKGLRANGRYVEHVALLGLGDLVEGCAEFYPMQQFQTDLTRREQTNVVRRLMLFAMRRFAEADVDLTVACVGGNHGENRKNGKAYTTFGDNDDVAVFEQLADIVAEAPDAFGYPTFVIPRDELAISLDLSGIRVGLVHGHQFGGGATPGAKALSWWQKQALGSQPVGATQILLSGHLHHFDMNPWGNRTHFQAPAIDGGSAWFREKTGIDSAPGLLTMLVGELCGPTGWDDLKLL